MALGVETFADCKADFACSKKRGDDKAAKKSSGVVFDRMFIRHWDAWNDGKLNRLFVAELPVGKAKALTAATADRRRRRSATCRPSRSATPASSHGRPTATASWSVRAGPMPGEPWSTNFDLYQVSADGSGAAKNLTAANPAWDTGPAFSADGKTLYYRAMKRPGFEADRFALMAMDLATGSVREIAPDWDRSADNITLSADGKTIYTTAQDLGEHPLFAVDIAIGQGRPSWSATVRCPRSRSPDRRSRSRATR